jgi:hypothetical protein
VRSFNGQISGVPEKIIYNLSNICFVINEENEHAIFPNGKEKEGYIVSDTTKVISLKTSVFVINIVQIMFIFYLFDNFFNRIWWYMNMIDNHPAIAEKAINSAFVSMMFIIFIVLLARPLQRLVISESVTYGEGVVF